MKTVTPFIVCLLLNILPLCAEEEGGALLKTIQEKALNEKSLRIMTAISITKRGKEIVLYSGQVCAKGEKHWRFEFNGKTDDRGLTDPYRAACDGEKVHLNGLKKNPNGEVTEAKAYQPDRNTRQIRGWCATGFLPLISILGGGGFDQGDDHLAAVSEVKFIGREKLVNTDTIVIQYTLTYPKLGSLQVKAWLDPVKNQPIKREYPYGKSIVVETITSFEVNAAAPDSEFGAPTPKK